MYYPTSETPSPQDFFSKSVYEYNSADALQSNKVFKLKIINAKQYNGLENTNTELTSIVYDNYNNINSSTTYTKEGSSLIKTYTLNNTYDNLSSPYIIGRLSNSVESTNVSGSLMTKEESYLYTNNLLTQISKKGNNTGSIIEANQYDNFGNIITKTVTAPDPATPRVINFKYDLSGRFLIKYTDVESQETNYEYNETSGVLKKVTDPYLLSTSYTYDTWFKKLTAKNENLNKIISYTYTKNNNNLIFTSQGDSGDLTFTEETFDDLGRKIKSGVKDVNGNIAYVSYLYDIDDRNYKVSEPYFGGSPTQWNETKFDIYGRPIQNNSFNSRLSSINYSGLTTTLTDGLRVKVSTKNATGNIISMQENTGGIINYQYYANGNLKQSTYNGVDIKLEQDGWGVTKKTIDPASGDYLYDHNDLGELKSETSPNGAVTTTNRDAFGRVTNKTIIGPFTETETAYEYNNIKLPILITFTDHLEPSGSNTIITDITYDPIFKKPLVITENKVGYAKFTKTYTYDDIGRVLTESKKAEVGTKSSIVTLKYIYQFGSLYQIQDQLTSKVLWQVNSLNAKGQVIENIIGNGIKMTNTYDTDGYLSKIQHDKTITPVQNIITLTTKFDKNNDNLKNRINSAFGDWTETFKYDDLDRLTEFTNENGVQEIQNYEASGKIKDNALGTYNYAVATKPNQNTSITLTPEAAGYYANREGIFNDNMEGKGVWQSGSVQNTTPYTYDETNLHSGKTSLKFSNTTSSSQYISSNKWISIDNAEPTEYTYSAWVYSDNPVAEIYLLMKTPQEQNSFTDYARIRTPKTYGKWKYIQGDILIPQGIKILSLQLHNKSTGNIWFDDLQIRKTSIPTTLERKLVVDYNAFKSPSKIEESGVEKINFTYNDNNQRSTMFYGGFEDKLLRQYRKYYSADGTMEIKENSDTGNLEFVTYIGGDGYSAPVVAKSDGILAPNYLYLHRDYQGSIMAITDDNGLVVEKRLFDAWGNIVKVQDGADNNLNGLTILDRGYTGHEHLQSVGLINMNARLYDPKLHRFLSVDNYIQDPLDTQNYNQYGYVYNNPNKYVDFSGNLAQRNGPGDSKGATHPTELDEVIVSRRSPAGYRESYGPSLVMSPFSGITGNVYGMGRNISSGNASSTNQTVSVGGTSGITGAAPTASNTWAVATLAFISYDLVIPDPSDVLWPKWAGYAVAEGAIAVYLNSSDYVEKMNAEIDRISRKKYLKTGFVYELTVNKSGIYQNVRGMNVYLEAGDVWKYGETTGTRYSGSELRTMVNGGVTQTFLYAGNQMDIKIKEKYLIYGYFLTHAYLPPGNRIFR